MAKGVDDAVVTLLKKTSKKVFLRFIRMTGGEAWAAVAPKEFASGESNLRNGMPITVNGLNLKIGKAA